MLWTGYIIYYSTDVNAEIHDWVIEPVVGNRLTHQIQELTLDTPYYFKIQARNSKGMGPMSEAVQFRTPKGNSPRAKGFTVSSLVGLQHLESTGNGLASLTVKTSKEFLSYPLATRLVLSQSTQRETLAVCIWAEELQ